MNCCFFSGKIHSDKIELQQTKNGKSWVQFILMVQTGTEFTFTPIIAWDKLAEDFAKIKNPKGTSIAIECKYTTSSYVDKNGNTQYSNKFTVLQPIGPLAFAPGPKTPAQMKQESQDLQGETITYVKASEVDVADDDLPF